VLYPGSVSAFAMHSSGVKKKGDGLSLPPDNYATDYTWGECPECQYWPVMPVKTDMKACSYANTGDRDFYKTAVNMEEYWNDLGNNLKATYEEGGHC